MSQGKKKKTGKRKQTDVKWIVLIFALTMFISALMSFASSELLESASLISSFVILICIVLIGIVFDIIGVAVTSAVEAPFHSMASRKTPGAAEALRLLRSADRVSSFCNDVIGDICGVISGSASAVIAARAVLGKPSAAGEAADIFMSALVAAITVGGKACGKSFAIMQSTSIVLAAGKVIFFFKSLPQNLFPNRKKNQ